MSVYQSTYDVMGEALRAKDAAERKFHARNIKGARRSAIKAHNLCPSLEGISQMVATLEVHHASESKIDGESDWYRILSLSSSADEEEVKKQYKKLALLLHPDKNKSVGGEAAFKLVSEAWSVLSDKNRKMLYDQKMRDHSVLNGANGLYTYDRKANRRARKNAVAASAAAESTVRPPAVDTFWTSCNRCRMQYEYLRIYLNHNLLCPNCNHAFMAIETGYPNNGASSSFTWSTKPQQQKKQTNIDHSYNPASRTSGIPGTGQGIYQQENTYETYNNQSFQFNQYTKTTGAAYSTHTLEKAKRKNEENHVHSYFLSANEYQSGRGKHSNRRRNISNSYASVGLTGETLSATTGTTVIADAGRVNGINADDILAERYKSAVSGRKANVLREIFQLDTRGLLIDKTKAAIREKLQNLNISTSTHFAEKRQAERKEKHVENNMKFNGILSDNPMKKRKIYNTKDADVEIPATDEMNPEQKRVPVSIDVPDPDFVDFDKDRTERAFGNDQVWATYDSEDGMPRLYVMVQKVISLKPFRIRMSFLNSKSNSELAPINWIASGFTKTSGDFRVGRYQITETVNIFSHRVNWTKGPRGIIKITPKKGDTWALYRNWSPDWNELTPDDVIYKYEIVEVTDDFTEEQGVDVIPLLKVAGFKSVFHRLTGPDVVRRIPKEELFRFSHRVPSRLLTGEERNNAPKGCHELDPAATPVDLLKVITDVKEDAALEVSMQTSSTVSMQTSSTLPPELATAS